MPTIHKRTIFYLFSLCFIFFFITTNAQDSAIVLKVKKKANSIGIKYDLIAFDKDVNKPWHLLSLAYTRQIKKVPLIARINYANRFAKSGVQFEADAYPVISKKIYSFVNAGYSNDPLLFPKYRAGASLYISLPAAYEAEGGVRFLYFNSPTWIYTASIGKYYKKYWFNLSTFLTAASNNILPSFFLKSRYYLTDKDFVMLTLGTGISPDDRNNNIQFAERRLKSKNVDLSLKKTINDVHVILLGIGWLSQEKTDKKDVHQYNFSIGYQKLL